MGKFTLGSLFSGIGGLDLAAHWAGFDTSWFVEKEPFCQKVLNKHWPDVPIYGDVFECHYMPHVDVMCGGFPCQPFSVAGNRKGKDDERYLLPEMLRIVDEVQPYAVLFENVPGFPSLNDGAEFKYLLRALTEMGFDAEWGHIRASDIGAPHQRERWFLVAYASGRRRERGWQRIGGAEGTERRKTLIGTTSAEEITGLNQTELVNAQRGGWSGNTWRWSGTQLENRYIRERWTTQSRMGGAINGIPRWLDFIGWPARPQQPQFIYEPPRTTIGTKDRTARIKALGNAVVPQCAYPIFEALVDWLEEVKNG